jgi:hypothetical protein
MLFVEDHILLAISEEELQYFVHKLKNIAVKFSRLKYLKI